MNDVIHNDFFLFLVKDNNSITLQEIEDTEKFVNKEEFEDIQQEFMIFLNEFMLWCIKKLDIQINDVHENLLNKKVINCYLFK